jgi:hypothetical protein
LLNPANQHGIQSPPPTTADHQCGADAEDELMLFEALTGLFAEPVHEEAMRPMDQDDGAGHDHAETRP